MTFGKRADLLTGIILMGTAILAFREGAAMPTLKRGLGPGGYPMFIAVGLGVLGALLALQALMAGKGDGKPLFNLSWSALGRVLLFAALTFGYIQAIPWLGFILASIPFLFAATRFFGYRRYGVNAAVSVLLPLAVYAVFRYGFLVLIPTGSLF